MVMTGERVLTLEGGRNFRDMGGYRGAGGRRVKWKRLYRSGSMAALTAADYAQLAALGVRAIVDLRTTGEREMMPVDWARVPNLSYWARDYDMGFGDLRSLMAAEAPTVEATRQAMASLYQNLPFEQAPAYRELFRRLIEGEAPLVFNCSAGKDRTGVAAALILGALGVHADDILEDYLLTNAAHDWKKSHGDPASPVSRLSPELAAAVLGVEAEYLSSAMAAIEARHGSAAAYLREALEIGEGQIERLREHLLD